MLIWILALTVLLLMLVAHMDRLDKEYFDNPGEEGAKTRSFEDPNDIYDSLYASIYDKLFSPPERISFEKGNIEKYGLEGFPASETKLLDVCCGTAPHAEWLCKTDIDIVGIDASESMLQKARQRCTRARFYKGDITRAETFPPKSFTHAMMLYFSIYQFRNPKQVLDNIYSWLKPGGVLILHLVNPEKFDPILDAASPFAMFSLQKYSKERVTDSDVAFDQFHYRSRFIKDAHDDDATFEEIIKYNNPEKNEGYTYREHKHRLYMPKLDAMLDIVRSSGFTRHELVDMMPAGFEYQYLAFFTK